MSNKSGRNELCSCGSNKKFKKCCGLKELHKKQEKAKAFKLGGFPLSSTGTAAKSLATRAFKVVKKAEPKPVEAEAPVATEAQVATDEQLQFKL